MLTTTKNLITLLNIIGKENMKQLKPVKTFIIRNKETKAIYRCKSGKSSWKTLGHAKSAWHQSEYYFDHNAYFDDQDTYEIVELKPESDELLLKAKDLLKDCLDHIDTTTVCGENLEQDVIKFLLEAKNA